MPKRPRIEWRESGEAAAMKTITALALGCTLAAAVSGCDPVSLTLLGVGTGAGVAHQMGGYASKTFTEDLPRVRKATVSALNRMAIKVDSTETRRARGPAAAPSAERPIAPELA